MPPKAPTTSGAKGKKEEQKPKKVNPLQEALGRAAGAAEKLFKQHERERVRIEGADGISRQEAALESAVEKERLRTEREVYEKVIKEMEGQEQLAYKEYEKHRAWSHIPDASRLPNVRSESAISTFLSVWRDKEQDYDEYRPLVTVLAKRNSIGGYMRNFHFVNAELGIAAAAHRKLIDSEMRQCVEAYQLTEAIRMERDRSLMDRRTEEIQFFDYNSGRVSEQVLRSLDFVTCHSLLAYDLVLEGQDSEFLAISIPQENPVVKYGLWVKVKGTTRSFASLVFPNISIRFDPKSVAMPKLPRALGLSKENVAIRVIQLGFDPFAYHGSVGRQYYALNCILKVDLLNFNERPQLNGDWLLRSETREAHELQIVPYPPSTLENQEEVLSLRITFEVPKTIVMRQTTVLVGKWLEETKEWDPCSYTTAASATNVAEPDYNATDSRRVCLNTNEFATFAILQEKGFDVPYESWRLQPINFNQVMMAIEGRHRGDVSDREFRILIEDAQCILIAPDDPELEPLRKKWMDPATLVRMLSQAGFNFALKDTDAAFMANIVPKSSALEEKVYADIAQFCQFHVIAYTKHNKCGEDANLALFRISKQSRALDADELLEVPLDEEEEWHSVRYQTKSCAFAAFKESEDNPNLHVLKDCEFHLNLYTLLLKEFGDNVEKLVTLGTNFLMRRCVFQLLSLIRPLTWG